MRPLFISLCIFAVSAPASALTLSEAQTNAATLNPMVKAAISVLKQKKAQLLKASLPDPELAVERRTDGEDSEIGILQTLPVTGRLSAEHDSARAEITAAELEVDMASIAIRAETRKLFHSATIATEKVRFGDKNATFALELLNKVETLVLSGKLRNTDLIRARIELDRARLRKSEAGAELTELKSSLNRLMGKDPAGPLELEADTETFHINGTAGTNSTANRLDLRILVLHKQSAALLVKAEKRRRLLPDLTIGATAVKSGEEKSAKFSFGIALPIWSGTKGAIMEAEGVDEATSAAQEAAALDASHELAVSSSKLNLARQKAQVLQRNLDSAHELRRLASLDYLAGKTQLTEYYEANRVFIDSNLEYLDSVKDYQWAKADFEKALLAPLSAGEEK